eukprot:8364059-Pyramimonas_sp.AAC.1
MAEHYAFYMALRLMGPRATIITDHKNLLIGFQKGPEKMCRVSEPRWEVWSLIFWKLNDVGGGECESAVDAVSQKQSVAQESQLFGLL